MLHASASDSKARAHHVRRNAASLSSVSVSRSILSARLGMEQLQRPCGNQATLRKLQGSRNASANGASSTAPGPIPRPCLMRSSS